MNLVPSETKTLRGSTSLSSLSRSSKNILSFTKLRPSSSKTNLRPTPPIENTALPQPRPVQRNSSRRLSMRDSHAYRNSAAIPGKRPGIQRRVSGKSYINGSSAKRPSTAPSASTPSSTFLPKSTGPFGSQPTSPITNSFKRTSIRVAPRQSMMRRLARKLQTSRTERDEDAMAELPIQRAPSLRRQPSRASNYRVSRQLSSRNSMYRSMSRRQSRPVSGIITPDFMFPPREPSRRLSPSRLETAEEYDSNFSTDSEADDPITMKATRIDRTRPAVAQLAPPPSVTDLPSVRDSLAALIEEIAGNMGYQPTRDTMESFQTWEMSLDQYCNAFPSPPTPCAPHKSPLSGIHQVTSSIPSNVQSLIGAVAISEEGSETTHASMSKPEPRPSSPPLPPELSITRASEEPDPLNIWNLPRNQPSPADTSRYSDGYSVKSPSIHRSINSIESSDASVPPSPIIAALARPRSIDRLAQARRRTRIVFGEVVDLVDDDQLDYGVSRSSSSVDRSLSPVWSNTAAMSIGAQMLSMSRRGSGGSSIPSIQEEEEEEEDLSEKAEVHPAQKSTFSLNSSEEGDPPIGVALTSEVREAATPSPITFAEPKSLKSTLFTRRKNRNHKLEGIRYPLRVDTPPPVPPLPDSVPSTATYSPRTPPNLSPSVTSLNPLEQYDSIKLNHFHKNSVADALPPPPPMPLSAPSKRKSFFRYPFVSKRSSSKSSSSSNTNSNGNERPSTSSRLASPPPPSPRAMAPPASAHHSRSNFFFTGRSIAGSLSAASNVTSFSTHGTPSSPPTATPRQFRSFSRPSSSNEKQPYGTTSYSQEGIARHVHEGPHFDNRRPGDVAYAT